MLLYAIYTFKKKSLLSFSIFYFFITISLAANFLVDIGTPLSERLLFQPSLAFCILLAVLFSKIVTKAKQVSRFALLLILILFSLKTYSRNSVWKNSETLYLNDIRYNSNSLRANCVVVIVYLSKANTEANVEIRKGYFKKAIFYSEQALKIYAVNQKTDDDLLTAYCGLFDCYQSVDDFLKDNDFEPSSAASQNIINVLSETFYKKGNLFYDQDNIDAAINAYQKCTHLNTTHVEAWYNLGGCYYAINDTIKANWAWDNVKRLNPDHIFKKLDFTSN
jgi:tetratricopeptide (TPR) repeat protein